MPLQEAPVDRTVQAGQLIDQHKINFRKFLQNLTEPQSEIFLGTLVESPFHICFVKPGNFLRSHWISLSASVKILVDANNFKFFFCRQLLAVGNLY